MLDLVIYGCGGLGREVVQLIDDCNAESKRYNLIGFVDDDPSVENSQVAGYPVLGNRFYLREQVDKPRLSRIAMVIGVGLPESRLRCVDCFAGLVDFPRIVHPSVVMGKRVTIEEGAIIAGLTSLTVDIKVDAFALINPGCTVGHDAFIGRHSVINPLVSISGRVHIGEGVLVGTGANILQGMVISDWSIIGGGALVNQNVERDCTVVGVPARILKRRKSGWQVQ